MAVNDKRGSAARKDAPCAPRRSAGHERRAYTRGVGATRPGVTDQDLLRLPKDGRKYELVDGEIRACPAGARHGEISLLSSGRNA